MSSCWQSNIELITATLENNKMSADYFAWFWNHPPTCKCGIKMRFCEKNDRYECYSCQINAPALAAMSDLRKINRTDLLYLRRAMPDCL
jgi:hypothetical protein